MSLRVEPLTGEALGAALDDLARLRIAVFAEWPYLYAGDVGYEREYLAEFASEPGSTLVAALDDGRIVGAATASPMAGQKAEFRAPFERRGMAVGQLFYFGESVLLPDYRGQGIGHAFFEQREVAARRAGASHTAFCAVVRSAQHPSRPGDYRPLDAFWRKRGYSPVEGMTTSLAWRDHGDVEETAHSMQFWMRSLDD